MGKIQGHPHDHWWANFVRAARLRTEQFRAQLGPDAKITWLVYNQGYRTAPSRKNRICSGYIDTVREKFNLNLV